MSRWFSIVSAICFAGVLAVGCSTVPSPEPFVVPPNEPALPAPVVKYKVAFLPLAIDDEFRADVARLRETGNPREYAFLPDADLRRRFVEEIVAAAKQLEIFADVRFLTGADDAQPIGDSLADAWDDGFDVVARPVLRRHHCTYVKETDAYVPNLILWLCASPIPTFWVADESFSSETLVDVEFYSTATRRDRPFFTRPVTGDVQHALDDFDQGFNLFNVFITPSGLSAGHWEDIGRKLLPLSERECQRQIIATGRDESAGFAADLGAYPEELHKTVAILVGTSPAGGGRPNFAIEDVLSLQKFFANGTGAGSPLIADWAIRPLEGLRATKAALAAAIADFYGTHVNATDRAMLFLALRGVRDSRGNGFLLLADSDPAHYRETGLSMAELAQWLQAVPAPVTVVAAITWDDAPAATMREDRVRVAWRPLTDLPNVVTVVATANRSPVLEMEQIPGSLFVAEIMRQIAAGTKTDTNRDGWLSWREITLAVRRGVETYSKREGQLQAPEVYGASELTNAPFFRIDRGGTGNGPTMSTANPE